jgi:hypothetical protein
MTNEVQPPPRPLPFGSDTRVGQPDRRYQIAPRQLGQHPGVDPVGHAGQRRETFYFLRVGDLDLPTGEFEPVVHEAGAVHRFDRSPNRRAMAIESLTQIAESVSVRR